MRKMLGVLLGLFILLAAPLPVKAATLQEQLDAGFVKWSDTQATLYLRANQTYYIGLGGANGGSGGNAYTWKTGSGSYPTPGSSGATGERRYYKIVVGASDIRMDVAFGLNGSNGEDGYTHPNPSVPTQGGAGGKNGFDYGSGASGTGSRVAGGMNLLVGLAGGGGGGGGASILKFNGDINQRLAASGGRGGDGANSIDWDYPQYNAFGGTGGAGGTVSNSATINGVTWQEISEAEAAALGVQVGSRTIAILKKFTPTSNRLKFADLPVGSQFVLVNTRGFASLLMKVNATEARIIDGSTETEYRTGTATTKQWYDFPDYALATRYDSQTGYYLHTIRADALFVGGDGTRYNPFYPEKVIAESTVGLSQDYSSKYDQIVNSLIYAGEKQYEMSKATSEQTQYLKRQAEAAEQQLQVIQEQAKTAKRPKIKYIGLKSGATITLSKTVVFDLAVEASGWQDQQLTVFLSEDGSTWVSKGTYSGLVQHSFTSSGYKTARIKVVDPNGAYDIAAVSFFIK